MLQPQKGIDMNFENKRPKFKNIFAFQDYLLRLCLKQKPVEQQI